MARPTKQGIDYYPQDVDADIDEKLGMIIAEFEAKGELLWNKLLCYIYKNNGYFTEWDDNVQLRFLRRYSYCGFSRGFINEVVPRFIKWGMLDATVFNTFQILTSPRIQKTWMDASRKRKDRTYDPKIWLIGVSSGIKAEETWFPAEETIQSKVKKSKVKKSRGDIQPPTSIIYGSSVLRDIEALKTECLADQVNFVEHICRQNKIKPEFIPVALDDFNAWLRSIDVFMKSKTDYRTHFQGWFRKQDISRYSKQKGGMVL